MNAPYYQSELTIKGYGDTLTVRTGVYEPRFILGIRNGLPATHQFMPLDMDAAVKLRDALQVFIDMDKSPCDVFPIPPYWREPKDLEVRVRYLERFRDAFKVDEKLKEEEPRADPKT